MEESIIKLKAAAALLQNMVSTEEEVRYNDLALFYIAKLLYEGIDELEGLSDALNKVSRRSIVSHAEINNRK